MILVVGLDRLPRITRLGNVFLLLVVADLVDSTEVGCLLRLLGSSSLTGEGAKASGELLVHERRKVFQAFRQVIEIRRQR